MSAALLLAMAVAGAHDCPAGYAPYGTFNSGYSAYSAPYGTVWYGSPSGYADWSYGYAAPVYGSAYGPAVTYGVPVENGGTYAGGVSSGYGAQGGVVAGYRPQGSQAAPIVSMTDRARFEPAQITVKVGETVEWRNTSRHPHTVTADPELAKNPAHVVLPEGARPFHSGEVHPGERFTHTFDTPGTYFYVCLPHEDIGMVGVVVVNPREGQGPAHERAAPPTTEGRRASPGRGTAPGGAPPY
ncbi:MAG: plastocyanin/azurin family copper-binding protein [Planctomycetales bacterium]